MDTSSKGQVQTPWRPRAGSGGGSRPRASRACDACRQRKIKCDGEKPVCDQCRPRGTTCIYSSVKRKREKEQLELVTSEVERYENLLRDISHAVDRSIARRIADALKESPFAVADVGSETKSVSSERTSIGSLDEVDIVDEDLNRNEESRATGYMGKNSEVIWMQRLETETSKMSEKQGSTNESTTHDRRRQHSPAAASENAIASVNYYLNNLHLTDHEPEHPLALPPRGLADQLFNAYFDSVDSSFPIVRKSLFNKQYQQLWSGGEAGIPGKKWLAILNLIFAISARNNHAFPWGFQGYADHTVFFSRARALSPGDNILYENADLQQVQIEALIAFYFLSSSQINRAWKMVGIAARSGIALGLNLQNNYTGLNRPSIEARTRVWWAIYYLEHLLSVMTSRTSCLGDGSCSCHPPLPVNEEESKHPGIRRLFKERLYGEDRLHWTLYQTRTQSKTRREWLSSMDASPDLYFFYLIDLAMITHTVTNRVYSTDVLRDGWAQIERRITLYSDKLDDWLRGLHPSFTFIDEHDELLSNLTSRYQVILALNYYSSRIILSRPCLTRPESNKETGIRFPRSRFGNDTALVCLQASLSLISIFPDEPDASWMYNISPWWCTLHFLMQATTLLLIHISVFPVPVKWEKGGKSAVGEQGTDESIEVVVAASKKAIRWLHFLATIDDGCRKAFELSSNVIRRMAPHRGLDVDDLPSASWTRYADNQETQQQQQQPLSPSALEEGVTHPTIAGDPGKTFEGWLDDIYGLPSVQSGFALCDPDTEMTALESNLMLDEAVEGMSNVTGSSEHKPHYLGSEPEVK